MKYIVIKLLHIGNHIPCTARCGVFQSCFPNNLDVLEQWTTWQEQLLLGWLLQPIINKNI